MAGAGLLSWQITMNRMFDDLVAAREADQASATIAVLRHRLQDANRRCDLGAHAFKALFEQAEAYEAECNRRFGELEARIAQLERQNAELTAAKEKAEAEVIEYAVANVRRILSDPT